MCPYWRRQLPDLANEQAEADHAERSAARPHPRVAHEACHHRPMSVDTVLTFAALAAVLVVIPGPAVILVLKSAMLRGRGSAVVTGLAF